jgi:hypothetical protein
MEYGMQEKDVSILRVQQRSREAGRPEGDVNKLGIIDFSPPTLAKPSLKGDSIAS